MTNKEFSLLTKQTVFLGMTNIPKTREPSPASQVFPFLSQKNKNNSNASQLK